MQVVADEAFDQMRRTLAVLHPSSDKDLIGALSAHIEVVSNRTQFEVHLENHGDPIALSPLVQRQVLYICREAMYNIEKHANAQHVNIRLVWEEDLLTVKISDDGSGFLPNEINWENHYGITIMHERADDINGRITINSGLNTGTEVILQLPL
jgi:signal transduction histidine kinase